MNDMQKRFAEAIANGLNQKEAAIMAGYSENQAASIGSRLMKNENVKAHVKRVEEALQARAKIIPARVSATAVILDMNDPLNYIRSVWQDEGEDPRIRLDAAKAALPYVHGKVAEKGKKETKADEAKQATSSGKFATLSAQLKC